MGLRIDFEGFFMLATLIIITVHTIIIGFIQCIKYFCCRYDDLLKSTTHPELRDRMLDFELPYTMMAQLTGAHS